jgi:hypothetical protein
MLKLLGLVDSSCRQKKKNTHTHRKHGKLATYRWDRNIFFWGTCLEEWSDLFFWVVYSV